MTTLHAISHGRSDASSRGAGYTGTSSEYRDWFRLGIVHPMAFPEAGASAAGFRASISAVISDPVFEVIEVTSVSDADLRRELRAMLQGARVEPVYAAQPLVFANRLDLSAESLADRTSAVDRLRTALDEAAELGARRFAVVSGPEVAGDQHEGAVGRLVGSLTTLSRQATAAGIRLLLETFDSDVDKRRLVGSNRLAATVARRVAEAGGDVGLMLDLSHIPLQHETIDTAIDAVLPWLAHVHIGNCVLSDPADPAYGDLHPPFGYPKSEIDVEEIAAFIGRLIAVGHLSPGSQNIVSFEIKPRPGDDPLAVIAGSKRTLDRAWRRTARPTAV